MNTVTLNMNEHVPVECRVHQAEYVIHIRAAASQEYVNTYSTRRVTRPRKHIANV